MVPNALAKATVTLVHHAEGTGRRVDAYFDVQELTILETREERLDREWIEAEPHRVELEEMYARMVDSDY